MRMETFLFHFCCENQKITKNIGISSLESSVNQNSFKTNLGDDFIYVQATFPNSKRIYGLCDTGCSGDGVVSPKTVNLLSLSQKIKPSKKSIELPNGISSTTKGCLDVAVSIGNQTKNLHLASFHTRFSDSYH